MSKREKYYGKEGFWIISVFGIMCIIFMTIYTMFIFKEVARQNIFWNSGKGNGLQDISKSG